MIYRLHKNDGLVPVKSSATALGNRRAGGCFHHAPFAFETCISWAMRGRPCLSLCVACWGWDADSSQCPRFADRAPQTVSATGHHGRSARRARSLTLIRTPSCEWDPARRSASSKPLLTIRLQSADTADHHWCRAPCSTQCSSKKESRVAVPSNERLQSHASAASSWSSEFRAA